MNNLKQHIQQIRDMLAKFSKAGKVPIDFAQQIVEDSAYWFHHPKGPIPVPKDCERIIDGPYGWQIKFGTNKFLVEQAILRCKELMLDALREVDATNAKIDCATLKELLSRAVRGAVANDNDERYPTLWGADDGYMHFGAHAIHVGKFVSAFLELAKLHSICR